MSSQIYDSKVLNKLKLSLFLSFSIFCLLVLASFVSAQTEGSTPSPSELKKLSVEELMDIEVTSVSKRPEKLSETPSAIQVITGEEIKRSGATSLPEALRLASNLEVAQVDSKQWAISARGFNNTLTNKLLVMIDGRTIYTPLYAGVFWDVQHVLLEDIDRIEVISGPGGTLWGANAVNGVINILTKSAKETQGALLRGGIGSQLEDFVSVRYGGKTDSNLFIRIHGQRLDHDNTVYQNGQEAVNDWNMTQGGFRMDWAKSEVSALTFQGDAYGGSFEQAAPGDTKVNGQYLLGRWSLIISAASDIQVQVYYDRTWREVPNTFSEELQSYDLDFQHRLPMGEKHSIIWGGGYRLMRDHVKNSPSLAFLPPDRNMDLYSGFLQDEITVVPEKLRFTLGTKLENNDFTGFEVLPSGRITWTPDERQTIWSAVSRAVRSPSRIDADLYAPPPPFPPLTPNLAGGPNFESEKVIAYELGYRVQPTDEASLSLATFFNSYDDLRSLEKTGLTTFEFKNGLKGESWGVELSGNYRACQWMSLRGGYTYLHVHIWEKPGHSDMNKARGEGNDPHNQFSIQSFMDLPADFHLNVSARYVDMLPYPHVPSYVTFDVQTAWQFKNIELSLTGQNLSDEQHPEFGKEVSRQEIPRSIYGKIIWRN